MSAIHTFFPAMVCFPDVQVAPEFVVSGRLPDFDDMDELPHLSAIVKEVLRLVDNEDEKKCPQLNFLSSLRWPPITPSGEFIPISVTIFILSQVFRVLTVPSKTMYTKDITGPF